MRKLLIVDDEQGIRDLFRFLLEPYGFKVITAENGTEGLELVKKESFDIIFLDIHMPKMIGPEVLREIKKLKPDQVVIIFSSSSDPQFIFETKAKEEGAFDCIYKPFDIESVLSIIEKALKIKIQEK